MSSDKQKHDTDLAAIAVITLYDTEAARLKLSHKNPKTTLATKNVVPITTLYKP